MTCLLTFIYQDQWYGKLVGLPSSHQRGKPSHTILYPFSRGNDRIWKGIPISDCLREEWALVTFNYLKLNVWRHRYRETKKWYHSLINLLSPSSQRTDDVYKTLMMQRCLNVGCPLGWRCSLSIDNLRLQTLPKANTYQSNVYKMPDNLTE